MMQRNPRNRDQKRNTTATRAASRTVERRIERERSRRRQRLIITAMVIAAVALIVAAALFIARQPSEAPIPEESAARYDGITMSRTSEGYARLGDPDAPVQVAEYSSFDCPHCREFHDQTIDQIVERVRAGNIAFTFVPLYGTGGITNGQGAAQAALCAGEQGAFWTFHDALFAWQGNYGNQAFTNSRIISGINALNLDRAVYDSCVGNNKPGEVLARARQQSSALLNFLGTPTVTINGVVPVDSAGAPLTDPNAVLAAIDNAIATAQARRQPTPLTEATPDATEEPIVEETAEATQAAE
jgi:protein-disulfide isomerase